MSPGSYGMHSTMMRRGASDDERSEMPTFGESMQRLTYLARFLKPYRTEFVSSIISNTLLTLLTLVIPLCFKQAIDKGVAHNDMHAVVLWVIFATVAACAAWGAGIVAKRTSLVGVRVLNDLRVALFSHVQTQDLSFFHRMRSGTVISRLTNDISALENVVTDGVFTVFTSILTLIGIEIFLFVLDWKLALAANIVMPVMLLATAFFRHYSMRAYRLTRERLAHVTAFLAEALAGIRIVLAFSAEERMALEFDETNASYKRANMTTIHLSAGYFPGVEWLSAIATAIVLYYGGLLSFDGAVTFGVLFAFVNYLNNFFDPIQQLSQFYSAFLSAMAALDKVMNVMETKPSVVDVAAPRRIAHVKGNVRFEHVSFRYSPNAPEAVRDVDFTVQAGETVALVGHTGAGKSTIVRLLTRFQDPTTGRVLLDGHDLRELEGRWLRRSLGIVPQEGFLFSTSIAENIRFGRPDASNDDVLAAARAVGADHFIDNLDDHYGAELSERGGNLSAGERQLVAFARALLADPALLVLDEATASVDVQTELRLAEGLRTLVAGRTAFIVAHRLSTIRDADRIFVIDDGQLVEQGTHDQLMAQDGKFAQLYGSWSQQHDEASNEATPTLQQS